MFGYGGPGRVQGGIQKPDLPGGVPRSPSHAALTEWASALRQGGNPASALVPGGGQQQGPDYPTYTGGQQQQGPDYSTYTGGQQYGSSEPSIADLYRYYKGRSPTPYEEHYYTQNRPDQLHRDIVQPGQQDGTKVWTFENKRGAPYQGAITPIDQRAPLRGSAPSQPVTPPNAQQQSVIDYFRTQRPGWQQNQQRTQQQNQQRTLQQIVAEALRNIRF